MDWLEKEWYDKLRSIGMGHADATLLARIKARLERDMTLRQKLREDGFEGFCRWVEINCKDIYYAVKSALRSAWEWLKSLF